MTINELQNPEVISGGLENPGIDSGNPKQLSFLQRAGQTAKDVGAGFLKGAGKSIFNLTKSAQDMGGVAPIGLDPYRLFNVPKLDQVPEFLESQNTAQKVGSGIETAAEVLAPLPGGKRKLGESLISSAERIFESAMKPSTELSATERAGVVRTALKEGISLTERGMQKMETKIDDLEKSLSGPIERASKEGKKISLDFLRTYSNEAKKILGTTADVVFSDKAVQNIDNRFNALAEKYPGGIPIDEAQKMKVATYQLIRNAYGKLKTSTLEYQKQIARGLKEGVIEHAPEVGGINENLKKLYALEKQMEKSVDRIRNADLLRLGTRVVAGIGGKVGTGLAIVSQIFGPATKSLTAIQMNKLGEFLAGKSEQEIRAFKTVAKTLGPINLNNFIQSISRSFNND